jgi:hypothetical protein
MPESVNKHNHDQNPQKFKTRVRNPQLKPSKSKTSTTAMRRIRMLAFLFLFVIAMLGAVLLAGFLGARAGQAERQVRGTATLAAYVQERLQKCDELLRAGNFVLAEANCAEVVKWQPDNVVANNALATARVAQTPTPAPPTATPRPITTDKNELLRLLQKASAAEDWESVIAYSDQLRAIYPAFEADAVHTARYQALVARGLQRLRNNSDEIEAGIFDLDQAAQIRALDDNVAYERNLAEAYLDALSGFGADWDTTIALLGKLPMRYRDVGTKLYEANLQAGEALSQTLNYCQAAIRFTQALSLTGSTSTAGRKLEAQRSQVTALCQLYPNGGISGTVGAGAGSAGTVYSVAGIAGKLIYSAFDAGSGYYQLRTMNTANSNISVLGGATQPVYQPSAGVAALNGGSTIYGLYSNGGMGTLANVSVGGVWPSVAPDGSRVAYAVFEHGEYHIYVARTDNGVPPINITKGTWPVWGPSGRIAYQGCTDLCGIHLINPDNPSEVIRLTTSAADVNMQWSPNGAELVYASNYSGQWAIYRVGMSGQFQQLTDLSASACTPTWSPDGARIAFQSNRDGGWAIYIMNADGSSPQKLLDLGTNHTAWQTDRLAWMP